MSKPNVSPHGAQEAGNVRHVRVPPIGDLTLTLTAGGGHD
jgi:hypothetical protein